MSTINDNGSRIPQLPQLPLTEIPEEKVEYTDRYGNQYELRQIEIGLSLEFGPVLYVASEQCFAAVNDAESRLCLVTQDDIDDFYETLE